MFKPEKCTIRTISMQSGTRVAGFRDAVRERDRRCVVTREPVLRAQHGIWRGFQAAHIFPLAYEGHWTAINYGRYITIPPARTSMGSINSVQNGMLLRDDIHSLFDDYDISINPDDDYKIVCFGPDSKNIAGTHLAHIVRTRRKVHLEDRLPGAPHISKHCLAEVPS